MRNILLLSAAFLAISQSEATAQTDDAEVTAQPTLENTVKARVKDAADHNFLSLSFENDVIGSGDDGQYTNGLRLTYFDTETKVPPVIDELAKLIPTFDINRTTSTYYSLGQNIYTPDNIRLRNPDADDRPYAAWLYGSVGLASITQNHLDELEFTLGVVGPQALGEQTQKAVHRHITNSPIPKGWRTQLEFEPGVILSARRRWPTWYTKNIGPLRLRVEPDINVSLGNIYAYAGTGASVTLGPYEDRIQDTPTRVRPSMPGTGFFDSKDNSFSWFLFAGVDGRAIARNIFLDGNSFSNSANVDKKHFVSDASAGIAFAYDDYRLAYTLNYRTREFDDQDDPALFGSITLSTRF